MRSSSDAALLAGAIRSAVKRHDPDLHVVEYRTVDEQIDRLLRPERLVASLSLAFGLLATGLAAIGLYGVTAFSVARRTREIGIRMGLGLSLGLARYVESQLYRVPARDILTMTAAAALLAAVALASGWLPARRASRVDPMFALRQE